jgi:hypothetical protein
MPSSVPGGHRRLLRTTRSQTLKAGVPRAMTTKTWREVRADLNFDEADEVAIAEHRARMDDEVRDWRIRRDRCRR